jgi:hypothetical protein
MLHLTTLAEQLVGSLSTAAKQSEVPLDHDTSLPGLYHYSYQASELYKKQNNPGEILHIDAVGGCLFKTIDISLSDASTYKEEALRKYEEFLAQKNAVPLEEYDSLAEDRVTDLKEVLDEPSEGPVDKTPEELVDEASEEPVEEASKELVDETSESVIIEVPPLSLPRAKTEDELWIEETGFGINDVEMSEEVNFDYASVESPEDSEISPYSSRIDGNRVTLVVENLVVNQTQATVHQENAGQSNSPSFPTRPNFVDYTAPAQLTYTPLPQSPAQIQVQAQVQAQAQAQVQAQAATQPSSVTQSSAPGGVVEQGLAGNEDNGMSGDKTIYNDSQTPLPLRKPLQAPTQVVDINLGITTHKSVLVQSTDNVEIPGLGGFDPSKYFNSNEISPRSNSAKEVSNANGLDSANEEESTGEPETLMNSDIDLSALIAPKPYDAMSGEIRADVQKTTQMFRELRRLKDR